jgi:uncharacterized protein
MTRTRLFLLTCLLGTTAIAQAASPSFDCAKATHEVEQMICKDAALAELDHTLNSLYHTVLKHTPASEQGALKTEQRGWVKGRNDCWKASDVRGCIASEYQTRIAELKDR